LLGLTAEADDVDDAGHLLELALEDPILRGLEIANGVALAFDGVAKHFSDRVPGRDVALHARRKLDELKSVDDFLARVFVARAPFEVTLHVREAEERLRSNVIEPGHAGEPDLERDRDVALGLFGAPSRRLRD